MCSGGREKLEMVAYNFGVDIDRCFRYTHIRIGIPTSVFFSTARNIIAVTEPAAPTSAPI